MEQVRDRLETEEYGMPRKPVKHIIEPNMVLETELPPAEAQGGKKGKGKAKGGKGDASNMWDKDGKGGACYGWDESGKGSSASNVWDKSGKGWSAKDKGGKGKASDKGGKTNAAVHKGSGSEGGELSQESPGDVERDTSSLVGGGV